MQDLGKNSGITGMIRGSPDLTWHSLNSFNYCVEDSLTAGTGLRRY